MRCPSCGEDNSEGAKFCHGCGAALERELACQNCGTPYLPGHKFCEGCGQNVTDGPAAVLTPESPPAKLPTSFGNGRYQVKKFLGEGGKKRVYLTHDGVLDRDVAFALIKTEGLDETSRTRVSGEA